MRTEDDLAAERAKKDKGIKKQRSRLHEMWQKLRKKEKSKS